MLIKTIRVTLLVVALVFAALGVRNRAAQAPAATPTYNAQVAPILFANCITCHRPGGIAPFSLMTYEDAQQHARAIVRMTQSRAMPPWYADPQYGQFKNAPKLTDQQIATLSAWADSGTTKGEGAPPVPPKVEVQGWRMNRPPDRIIELPFGEFELPASGEVQTFTVWLKPFNEERFVQAIEIRPSVQNAVHHSSLSLGNLPQGTKIGRAPVFPGGPVLDGVAVLPDGRPLLPDGGEQITDRPVMFYVPGGGFLELPGGMAKRFGRDDYLSWGLHLVSPGRSEKVRVQIGIWFAKGLPRKEMRMWTLTETLVADGRPLDGPSGARVFPEIPAGAVNWPMTGSRKIARDITIHSLWPHMHYRGKDMTFVVTDPNGRQTTILSVPNYNPHWQLSYELAKPLKIKRGSTITAYGHFDNSAANMHNPDPTAAVKFGPRGIDEMFLPFIEVTLDDENLALEQFALPPR